MTADELVLEQFTPSHYEALSSWFENQHQLTQWGGPAVRYPLDVAQMQAMLTDRAISPQRLSWMAVRNHQPVGHAQAITVDTQAGAARLGRIAIAPELRGQRLAIPMLRLVLDQVFAIPGIERIDLGVYTWNSAAIRTYGRLGFAAGRTINGSVRIEGQDWDVQEMSLSRGSKRGR